MAPPLTTHRNSSKGTMQSFKKRKHCIFKKIRELSILCDIKACALIVDHDGKIECWPENCSDVQGILKLHQKDGVFTKKKHGKESGDQEILKLQQKGDGKVGEESAEDLLKLVELKLESVNSRIEWVRKMKSDEEQYQFFQSMNENQNSGIQCFEPLACDLDWSVMWSPLPQISFAAEDFGGYDFESMQCLQSQPCNAAGYWSALPCPQPQLPNVNQILDDFEELEASQQFQSKDTSAHWRI